MRNAVAFEVSSFLGMEFTPAVRFVDVVLNGEFMGNYMVSDQVEVAKGRVPVEEQETTDTEEPAITGGYLIELDGFASSEPVWFQTPKGLKVKVKYPKDDEINMKQRDILPIISVILKTCSSLLSLPTRKRGIGHGSTKSR